MIDISISEEVTQACPELHLIAITCRIANTSSDEDLWQLIAEEEKTIRASMQLEDINKQLPILATRQAYKRFGKDPGRYRPSAEALLRRILRDLPLYHIDTMVDIINLVSIRSGYSIGGFDADKISGPLVLGVGRADEKYEAIGRGELNIEGLPVYRDQAGGIGTPTSDEERTKIDINTSRLLMIINGYAGKEGLVPAASFSAELLTRYVSATDMEAVLITPEKKEPIALNFVNLL